MTEAILFRSAPNAQYHFGKVALDENTSLNDSSEFPHSDTLFSAIVLQLVRFLDIADVKAIIEHFKAGDVRLSSACFCLEMNDKKVFFLHKPAHFKLINFKKDENNTDDYKKWLKVKYISKDVWEKGYCSREDWETHCVLLYGDFLLTKEEAAIQNNTIKSRHKPVELETFPKVRVHHHTNLDSFYFQTNVQLARTKVGQQIIQPHYYFLLQMSDEFATTDAAIRINTAIDLLEDTGIGGGRSGGTGFFEKIERQDFVLAISASEYVATTGLLSPTANDLNIAIYYETITRGGRPTAKDKQLKYVRMMQEGTVGKVDLEGNIPDIRSDQSSQPYLRYGKALCLPIHENTYHLLRNDEKID